MIVGGSSHPSAHHVDDEGTLREALSVDYDTVRDDLPPLFLLRPVGAERGGPAMLVGVRGDRGVLWWSHPEQGESVISAGGDNPSGAWYHLDTAENELPPRSEIPIATVLASAVEFLKTGRRPTTVQWLGEDAAWEAIDRGPAVTAGSPRS